MRMTNSCRCLPLDVLRNAAQMRGMRERYGKPSVCFCFCSWINPPRIMVDPFFAETLVRIYLVSIVGTELPLMSTFPFGTRLSIFCKISSDTSFSELMSGTTSSCKTTFLYSMLDWIEPTFRVVVAFVKVLVG